MLGMLRSFCRNSRYYLFSDLQTRSGLFHTDNTDSRPCPSSTSASSAVMYKLPVGEGLLEVTAQTKKAVWLEVESF